MADFKKSLDTRGFHLGFEPCNLDGYHQGKNAWIGWRFNRMGGSDRKTEEDFAPANEFFTKWASQCKLAENRKLVSLHRIEGGLIDPENESRQIRMCIQETDYVDVHTIKLIANFHGKLGSEWSMDQLLDLMDAFTVVMNARFQKEGEGGSTSAELIIY